jgi:acyl carrier protein
MSVQARVRQFVSESFLVDDFSDDDSFLECGIIDSLGVMQLVAFVESEFSVRVNEPDLVPDNFDSVAKVARYVERRRLAA